MEALSSSQAPMGTRDAAPEHRAPTRVESPAARNRTPHPPTRAQVADSGGKSRPSKSPPTKSTERPEERIGTVLGSYRIRELLGRGGMGFVYKAEHTKLGRPVALKLLRADYARRRDSVARFIREAQAVNRIRHRNIVDVPDVVELDDGTTYIIMELLEGQSLGKWAKAGFSIPRALALLVQICDGLGAAHAVGIVHRDLKPDNVFVVPGDGGEMIKLLDFGVAKLLNHEDDEIGLVTQAGSVIGTPAYMSPEQAGGMTVDVRSDIYSLGAIMYELFTGAPMFKGRSFGEYVRKHLNEFPVPPRKTPGGAELDERLEQVILRCLEKHPPSRYQTTAELRDDLLHLLGGIDTQVGMVRELAGTDSLSSRDLLRSSSSSSSRRSRASAEHDLPAPLPTAVAAGARRWPWLVSGLVVAAAAGAATLIALSGDPPKRTAPREERAATAPPAAVAVEPLAPTMAPRRGGASIVAVLFESSPPADVSPIGSASKQCSTPCTVSIDPDDGGNASHRDFVVRASGHVEQTVTIDLATPPPSVWVALEHRKRNEPVTPTAPLPADPAPAAVVAEPEPPPVTEALPAQPEPPPPVVESKPKKIDRTQTLDPFRTP